jgi:hypothetical protein
LVRENLVPFFGTDDAAIVTAVVSIAGPQTARAVYPAFKQSETYPKYSRISEIPDLKIKLKTVISLAKGQVRKIFSLQITDRVPVYVHTLVKGDLQVRIPSYPHGSRGTLPLIHASGM